MFKGVALLLSPLRLRIHRQILKVGSTADVPLLQFSYTNGDTGPVKLTRYVSGDSWEAVHVEEVEIAAHTQTVDTLLVISFICLSKQQQ